MPVPTGEELVPIRTVASLTGISAVTLRAWERRYGLVRPRRSPSGHRLYTRGDVARLRRAAELVSQGVPVGRVGPMLDAEPAVAAGEPAPAAVAAPGAWDAARARMLDAVSRFDGVALDGAFNDALAAHPFDVVQRHVVVPVLEVLGERWAQRAGGVAEEHFFSTHLRNRLGARFHHLTSSARGPKLVTACLPGDRHDLGLLMFCLAASARGYRVVMLGPSTPLGDVVAASRAASADALVLSASVDPEGDTLSRGLAEVVRAAGVPVFVGGRMAERRAAVLEAAGAVVLGTRFDVALARIDRALGARAPAPD